MAELDHLIGRVAANDYGLVTRPLVHTSGGTDRFIRERVSGGHWLQIHPGVYQIGAAPLDWFGRLRAATLAAGPLAVASHRAAVVLWGLDGISQAPLELTVPVGRGPLPAGVVVHRTRRVVPAAVVRGIPVSSPERTTLDIAWSHNALLVEQIYESGVRTGVISPGRMAVLLDEQGRYGVRGTDKVLRVLQARQFGRPTGSPPETILLHHLQREGIEQPVCQHTVHLPDGSVAILDFAWPQRLKAVEVDGLEAHANSVRLESDLKRQNLLFSIQWQLRRFTGRQVLRRPKEVVAEIAEFLAA